MNRDGDQSGNVEAQKAERARVLEALAERKAFGDNYLDLIKTVVSVANQNLSPKQLSELLVKRYPKFKGLIKPIFLAINQNLEFLANKKIPLRDSREGGTLSQKYKDSVVSLFIQRISGTVEKREYYEKYFADNPDAYWVEDVLPGVPVLTIRVHSTNPKWEAVATKNLVDHSGEKHIFNTITILHKVDRNNFSGSIHHELNHILMRLKAGSGSVDRRTGSPASRKLGEEVISMILDFSNGLVAHPFYDRMIHYFKLLNVTGETAVKLQEAMLQATPYLTDPNLMSAYIPAMFEIQDFDSLYKGIVQTTLLIERAKALDSADRIDDDQSAKKAEGFIGRIRKLRKGRE